MKSPWLYSREKFAPGGARPSVSRLNHQPGGARDTVLFSTDAITLHTKPHMITPSFFSKQPSDRNGFSWGLNRTENVDQEDESQRKIPELPLKEDHVTVYERFVGDIKRSSWGVSRQSRCPDV